MQKIKMFCQYVLHSS